MKKKPVKQQEQGVMSRDEMLSHGSFREAVVNVAGWPKPVKMQTIPFQEYIDIQLSALAKDDNGEVLRLPDGSVCKNESMHRAAIVAAVCPALSIDDAMAIESGNGAMFATLYSAVDEFLSYKPTEEKIKN